MKKERQKRPLHYYMAHIYPGTGNKRFDLVTQIVLRSS